MINIPISSFILLPKPFPKQKIVDFSKPREFVDDSFEFGAIGRKFSKRVENTVGKGEIAHNKYFLLFPILFSKEGLFWERVNKSVNKSDC